MMLATIFVGWVELAVVVAVGFIAIVSLLRFEKPWW